MNREIIENPCKGCPIRGHRDKVKLSIPKKARFLIVTKPVKPGGEGRVLSEGASGVLSHNLKEAGFKQKDFAFMPSVRCGFDKDRYTTADKKEITKRCRTYLNQVIQHVKPEVIIPLGVDATQMVEGRAVKISKARGVLSRSEEHHTNVMPTYDPEYVFQRPENEPLFASDCRTLRRLVDHKYDVEGAGKEVLGDYKYVDDLQFLVDMKPKLLAVDIEATGLEWYRPGKILTLQFTTKPGEAFALVWDHPEAPKTKKQKAVLLEQLKKILCRRKTKYIGANLKFDMAWILSKLGIRGRIDEDVIMMAAVLDENLQNKGLDTLTKLYAKELAGYADHFNATHDKSDMASVPLSDLLPYAGGDSDATMRVYLSMSKELKKDEGMYNHYKKVSIPGLNAFLMMERPGSKIDGHALNKFEKWLTEDVRQQRISLMAQVPKSIKRAHMRTFAGKGRDISDALSFTRPEFTRDVLFNHSDGFGLEPKVYTKTTQKLETKFQIPSISTKDHLPYFYQECPFTYELAQYIKDERILSTNIKSYRKKYIYKGEVHPIYSLSTAATGRSSCLRGDVLVSTGRGEVRADNIVKGDYVFTHKYRWRRVVKLFQKPPTQMYRVKLSNGNVLICTGQHLLLLDSGVWSTLDSIVDKVHSYDDKQKTHARQKASEEGGRNVQENFINCAAGRREAWSNVQHGKSHDTEAYICGGLQKVQEIQVQREQAGRKEPTVWEQLGIRLRGWEGLPNKAYKRKKALCTPHSDGWYVRYTGIETFSGVLHPSYRRRYQEQRPRQFSLNNQRGTPADTQEIQTFARGIEVKEVDCEGVHRVYDFQVDEDHSYLASGVFNHNSHSPNGQNTVKRGKNAKKYRRIFIPPKGRVILGVDLSQAEVRIAGDTANDATIIDIYNRGGDIHKRTACVVMGLSEDQFDKLPRSEQGLARFKAKACIAEGQKVFTDSGLIPIESVTTSNLVWDGLNYVSHEGVESRGVRYVMEWSGFTGTPEHIVFTEIGAMPLYLAREIQEPIVKELSKGNNEIVFYYGILERVRYLRGKLHEGVNTESLTVKAKGYGFADLVNLDEHLA